MVRVANYVEREMLSNYGAYSSDNEAYQYIEALFRGQLSSEEEGVYRIVLTRGWDAVNACALPNGTVMISDRLLTAVAHPEELQFVLRHELTHLRKKHHEDRATESTWRPSSLYWRLRERVLRPRLHEYEADLWAFLEESETPFNPYGGMVFMERLHQEESQRGSQGGLVHGRALDRLVNLHSSTRIVDMAALTNDLGTLPEGLVQSLDSHGPRLNDLLVEPVRSDCVQTAEDRRTQALASADLSLLAMAAGKVYSRWCAQDRQIRKGRTEFSGVFQHQLQTTYINRLLARARSMSTALLRAHNIPAADRPLYRGFLAAWQLNLPLQDALDPDVPMGVYQDFFDALEEPEDYHALPAVMAGLHELDQPLRGSPVALLQFIVNAAADAGTFDVSGVFQLDRFMQYCADLSAAACRLHNARNISAGAIDQQALCSALLPFAVLNVPAREVPQVTTRLVQSPGVNTGHFYRSLSTDVQLPVQTLNTLKGGLLDPDCAPAERETLTLSEIATHILLWRIENVSYLDLDKASSQTPRMQACRAWHATGRDAAFQRIDALGWRDLAQAHAALVPFFRHYLDPGSAATVLDQLSGLYDPARPYVTGTKRQHAYLLNGIRFWQRIAPTPDAFLTQVERMGVEFDFIEADFSPTEILELYRQLVQPEDEPRMRVAPEDVPVWLSEHCIEDTLVRLLSTASRASFFAALAQLYPLIPTHRVKGKLPFLNEIFERYTFDLDVPQDRDDLLTITALFPDSDLASQIQENVFTRLFPVLDSAALQRLLFEDPRTRGLALGDVRLRFVEEHLCTPAALHRALRRISTFLDTQRDDILDGSAALYVLGSMAHMMRQPLQFVKVALSTVRSDAQLKQMVFERWMSTRFTNDAESFEGMDEQVQRMYGLDEPTLRLLVKTCLIGKNGILMHDGTRRRFIDHLLEQELQISDDPDEQKLGTLLRDVLHAMSQSADIPTLFSFLAPFLHTRLFRPPQERVPWEEIVAGHPELTSLLNLPGGAPVSELAARIRTPLDPEHGGISALYRRVEPYLPPERPDPAKRPSPIQFLLELASNLGAPAVRALQIIGQYIDLPPAMEEEFSRVYDAVPGQSKLSAFYTMRREWPALDAELHALGATIGGGSLSTVFSARTVNGKEAIKMLNPNTDFHVQGICDILERSFALMQDAWPLQARLAERAMQDIRQWLHDDIHFPGFLEKDAVFRGHHHGWGLPGSRYRIYIPQSYGPASLRLKREEFIPGENLTKWSTLEQSGHDMKEIVRLLVFNLRHQIKTGRLHADVHPGNIRIMPDDRVALLDRNFYLDLDDADRQLVQDVMQGGPHGLIDAFGRYLAAQPENASIHGIGEILRQGWQGAPDGLDPAKKVVRVLASARAARVHIPLRVTLFVKNVLALDHLARKAGYANLIAVLVS